MTASPAPLDVQSACSSKKAYRTEEYARGVAVQCWRKRGIWLRAYACDFCGAWHLTKQKAAPVMQPGWRPPAKSKRQQAHERKQRRRRRW